MRSKFLILATALVAFIQVTSATATRAADPQSESRRTGQVSTSKAERKGISLTPAAAAQIKQIVVDQKLAADVGIRVEVSVGGCDGFLYGMKFEEKSDASADVVFNSHGVRVIIDKQSLLYAEGTEIDYYRGFTKAGFTFDNPNAKKTPEVPKK